ncbi:hypothetical protein, conserved [Babesia ovata]|uniref:Extracellular matrix-binding ebh n=1 Tax=Babesia ovata TaxID=189622 RepID=A0A2H6KJZ7_9APIC|nr:uncharacterized protein BOVATA_048160 [Babesia ovata]GBE63323.1 hypothetical protein, conserved [Babesia ovata]
MDEQRMSSLEAEVHHGIDVIVKLTQFSGGKDSVLELIKKEIERLEKQHKDCEKSPQPHASSDCPQHKLLEELKEKLETLTQNKDNSNCETLLNNLCSGLEKFLGYQETSKGYDGTGIVYSDLDRLCDGVMSFLHGVLDTVRDDESVKTYDDYMRNNGQDDLHTVLQHLQSSIGQGRSVFGERVEEVNGRTLSVINALGELITDKIDSYATNVLSGHPSKELQQQLREWTSVLGSINDHIKSNIITNVAKLDPALGEKIMRKIEPVQRVVEQLRGVAGNDEVVRGVVLVDEHLEKQRDYVLAKINSESKDFGDKVEGEFWKLDKKVKGLEKTKITHFTDIYGRLKEVHEFFGDDFDIKYKKKIDGLFSELANKMTQIDPKNSNSNDGNISILKEKFEKVKSDIDLIGTEVDGEVADLSTWKTEADKVVKEAKKKCEEIIAKLSDDEKSKIAGPAGQLRQKATQLLAASVDAKRGVTTAVQDAVRKFAALDGMVTQGLENFKGKITPTISGCLTNLKDIDFAGGRVIKLGTLSTKGHVGEWLKNNLQSSSGLNGAFKSLGQDNESILQSIFNVLKVENIVNGQRDVTFFKALDEDIHNAIKDIINLKNLSDPMQSLRTELNGDGLHRAVSGITVKVKDLTDQVNQQAESSLIDGYFDGIWNALDDLCSGVQNLVETTGNGGIKKDGVNPRLNELEKGLQTTKLRDSKNGLHDIHAHLGQLQIRIAEVTKADASTKVADIIAELEGLPELLNRKRSDAGRNMDDLRMQLTHRLKIVETNIQYADTFIQRAIKTVQQSLQLAHHNITELLYHLTNTVLKATDQAFQKSYR